MAKIKPLEKAVNDVGSAMTALLRVFENSPHDAEQHRKAFSFLQNKLNSVEAKAKLSLQATKEFSLADEYPKMEFYVRSPMSPDEARPVRIAGENNKPKPPERDDFEGVDFIEE
jgi:hypothetical protein